MAKALRVTIVITFCYIYCKSIQHFLYCAFSLVVQNNRDLEVLNLAMNGFSSVGAKALANALLVNKTLLHLDISNNRIGFEGCQTLCKVFEKAGPLHELMVSRRLSRSERTLLI